MGIIAKYKFNQNVYTDFIPTFNDNFTSYAINDEIDTDGFTVRTIESDNLPTSVMFGQIYNAENDNATPKSLSLLEIYEMDLSTVTHISSLFRKCKNLTAIHCQFNCNFNIIKNMQEAFRDCSSLTSLDVSSLNTSQVTNMEHMFDNCSSLTSLDVSNFNTNQVTNMNAMFYNCSSLTSLDISNFDISQVTNIQSMFQNCSSLTSLDISNFDTSQVTNMSSMFSDCSSLTSLDISNFNTENVNTMYAMFQNCSSLTSLDVSNFNTSKVTNMISMFYNCNLLTSLDISNFNTSQVTNMGYMFSGCKSLTSLDVSNFDTSQVTNMRDMFYNCSSLISLDVSNFNTSQVTNMNNMFRNCSSLISLDASNFDTSNVTNMSYMFYICQSLTSLDVSNFNTSQVTNMNNMFTNCSSLTSLDVSNFNTSNVATMDYMFQDCSSLISLDVSNFNTSNVVNMGYMFNRCSKLIDIGMIYCNSSTINKISNLITTNTIIYYSLPDVLELEPHDNIEYIKYIFPTKIQLPPHIQLHSLPDGTCDKLDIKTGILTRNVGEITFTGDEQWDFYNGHFYMYHDYAEKQKGLCDKMPLYHNFTGNPYGIFVDDGAFRMSFGDNNKDVGIFKQKLKLLLPTLFYKKLTPTTEKIILNYNNSCNYGVILPRGTSDNYNVITNEYKQNLDFIPIDGSIAFDTATIKDTTVKFSVALSKFEVDITNVRGSDGIYCDNNLFKYETSNNDYEHAYIENDTTLHVYVNKSRLSSYDQVGFQLYLTNNPFDLYYAMRNTIISYVNYEDLDPEKASWEMLDCTEDGSITIESGNMDKTLLLDCMDYVAPTKNRFEIDLLKANTQYTVYAEGVSGRIQLNFGGNIVNFTSGNVYTSGETQLVEFYTDNEIKNLIIIEGDTRTETIDFFEGLKSSENITVISSNAPFVFGKGGKI